MKEIPVGEFTTIGNEVYKCVDVTGEVCGSCSICDIGAYSLACMFAALKCSVSDRSDCTEVVFILFDTEEEDQDSVTTIS